MKLIDLESTTWAKSLFKQMGFCKSTATTSKPEIPELAKREAKLLIQHQVANLVEKYTIPHSMIMNFDQTPSKCAPVSSRTLDIRGTSHVAIVGMSYMKTDLLMKHFLKSNFLFVIVCYGSHFLSKYNILFANICISL